MTRLRRSGRWNWAIGAALGLAATGLFVQEHVLVLAATIPLWYVAITAVIGLSIPPIRVERSIEHDATAPGEHVPVELTLTNEGAEPITDLRVIDRVPAELPVAEGTPRGCFSLEPDESATVSYAVSARRGEFEFDTPLLRLRNLTGELVADINAVYDDRDDPATAIDDEAAPEPAAEPAGPVAADGGTAVDDGTPSRSATAASEDAVVVTGDRSLSCTLPVEDVPLSGESLERIGRIETDDAGVGTQFHSVRDYQRGDSQRSIDWRRYARTGELTTVEYHEDRSTTAVVLVDARDETYISPNPADPAALTLNAFAAERAFDTLWSAGHEVGLSVITDGVPDVIGPGGGPELAYRAQDAIEEVRSRSPRWVSLTDRGARDVATAAANRLVTTLPDDAQLVYFTPALDEYVTVFAQHLLARGHELTIVSPDVVTTPVASQRLLAAERKRRLTELRATGATVVDWKRDRPLQLVLADAFEWGDRG